MAFLNRHPIQGAIGATVLIATIGGLALAGVSQLAESVLFHPAAAEPVVEVAPVLPVLAARDTPAEKAIQAALSAGPHGWSAQGGTQRADTAPNPYSCPLPGMAPSTTISRNFTAAGSTVKVTVAAYTAGLGADAMAQLNAAVFTCATPDSRPGWDRMYGEAPGIESYLSQVTKAGNTIYTASSRRGDVITYLTGASSSQLQTLAVAFDQHLAASIDPVCTSTDSTSADSTRSLFSAAGYSPFLTGKKVSVADPGLPKKPASSKAKSVSIPGPEVTVVHVEPTEEPEWPVWPLMPEWIDVPATPKSPSAKPELSKAISIQSPDTAGPGCGWAFTGMKAPVFNEVAATASNNKLTTSTETDLKAGTKAWGAAVLAYWEAYAQHVKDAAAYKSYGDKVAVVNKAWAAIAAQWDEYYRLLGEWEDAETARNGFIKEQKDASDSYIKEVEECAARPTPTPTPSPTPSAKPTPSPTATPTPSATATPSPTVSPAATEVAEPCKPVRPAILDEKAPASDTKPSPPADPRPADKR